jgi:hypothetical protein
MFVIPLTVVELDAITFEWAFPANSVASNAFVHPFPNMASYEKSSPACSICCFIRSKMVLGIYQYKLSSEKII